ncbi:outer membrane protein assembly factor BamC [Chitinimonas sp. BJYL2]|uniref:outer membrane protein assembly factor BamC n=1 Tax=Chitinimonas sp. BJYL2 TaxID=2976696 RepID=UPI0022B3A2F7|nr:outer membrane protein assembly factor BamC [Chitinimonas sp. BJYL2]
MIRTPRTSAALLLALLATGCANTNFHIPFFGNDDEPKTPEYAQARKSIQNRPLEVPPDLTTPEANGSYLIPGLNGAAPSAAGQKLLETGAVLPGFTNARLESAGNQRWLVVNAPADKVWPTVRQFWLDQGYKLTIDNPTAGLLETNWAEERPELPVGGIRAAIQRGLGTLYSTGKVNQYRIRLERASADSTEIYIAHRGMEENYVGANREDTRWTVMPANPEREAAQLKKLLVTLGVSPDSATQLAAAAKPGEATEAIAADGKARAALVTVEGIKTIQMEDGFDRAWRRVGLALERAGYEITDRDRTLGVYYVRPGMVRKAKEEGFLSKLAFWKDDSAKTEEVPADEVLVGVVSKGGQSTVRVGRRNGAALPEADIAKVLDPLLVELR